MMSSRLAADKFSGKYLLEGTKDLRGVIGEPINFSFWGIAFTPIPRVLSPRSILFYPNLNDHVSSPKISGYFLEWRRLRYVHEQLHSYVILSLNHWILSCFKTLFIMLEEHMHDIVNNFFFLWKKSAINSKSHKGISLFMIIF